MLRGIGPNMPPRLRRGVFAIEEGFSSMLDALLIAAAFGFFALAILYVIACDRM
jgi:hypothetical protein